jgi:predicted transcriptional regulator
MATRHPLRRWLFDNGESANHFAIRTGIMPATLSRIMNGRGKPRMETMLAIIAATREEMKLEDFAVPKKAGLFD